MPDPVNPLEESPVDPYPPPVIPPAPPATDQEDPERKWLREVYCGDDVPQLTVRAVVMGMFLGSFMAFSNLYVGLKTGWGLGVAITACIMSWAIFKGLKPILGSEPSILENNCMQSTASAAGYSTGSTLVSAFAAYIMIQGIQHPHEKSWDILPVHVVMLLVFFLAMLGVFMAIPMKRNMINVEQLAFPSGTAAAATLRSLFSSGAEALSKAKSLFISMALGALVAFWRDGMAAITSGFKGIWTRFPVVLPDHLPLGPFFTRHGLPGVGRVVSENGYTFAFDMSTIMIAAGAIMGLRTAASMMLGAVICYGVLAPMVYHAGIIPGLGYSNIVRWSVWGGVALMTTAALLNFALGWRTLLRAFSGIAKLFKRTAGPVAEDPLARIEVPASWFLLGTGIATIGCVITNQWFFHISIGLGIVAVLLSGLLAIVACRATGETDTTPIGALGKITQLTYGLLIPQNITANLMTANVTASIAGSSADLLTDLKSGYLLGANPRQQFLAQFFGVFAGTVVAVFGFYALVPTPSAIGSGKFPAPAAQVWKAVALLLQRGLHSLDSSAIWAMAIGGALGIFITLLEKWFPKHKHVIPSPTGLGLAFVIPAYNSISMFLGALIAYWLEKKHPKTADTYTIPVASGLIAGESIMGVLVALGGVLTGILH